MNGVRLRPMKNSERDNSNIYKAMSFLHNSKTGIELNNGAEKVNLNELMHLPWAQELDKEIKDKVYNALKNNYER